MSDTSGLRFDTPVLEDKTWDGTPTPFVFQKRVIWIPVVNPHIVIIFRFSDTQSAHAADLLQIMVEGYKKIPQKYRLNLVRRVTVELASGRHGL